MNQDFFSPINNFLLKQVADQPENTLGKKIIKHTEENGFPDLNKVKIALIGVKEDRNSVNNLGSGENLDEFRQKLYELFYGDWKTSIADLGDVLKGNTIEDTYFAVSSLVTTLIKKNIIPVIIGGAQDITYANYRAYDVLEQTVNITSVDSRFDLGSIESSFNSQSYLSAIVMQKPNNLFNFCNIGYQSYFNSQDEVKLLDSLFFDSYRLGDAKNLENIEPALRDSDIVSIDIGSVRQSDAPANKNASANGFYGEEICAISRYSGLSDKVSSFGIYEYNPKLDRDSQTASLLAQMVWYFIEGVNFRVQDYPFTQKENYQKFTVLLQDDDPLTFYKSNKSGRWWIQINVISDNKYKRHALIPCTYKDYKEATKQKIPKTWFKAIKKLV